MTRPLSPARLLPGLRALAVLAAFLVAVPTPGSARPPAPSVAAAQGRHDEFFAEFKKAMAINARDEMAKLVKSYPDEAVARIVYTCEQIAEANSEELETLIDGLRRAWDKAYGTSFVEEEYRYFSFLDSAYKRERKRVKNKYDNAQRRFTAAIAEKNQVEFELLGNELAGIAQSFETLGDRYYAAQSWYMFANCHDEKLRGNKADLEKAAEGYGKTLEHREAIELVGPTTNELKQRYKELVAEGWVEPETAEAGPAEPGAAGAAAAAAPPLTVAMSFEVIDDLGAIERPNYYVDGLYPMWTGLYLRGNGSQAAFGSFSEGSPQVHRVGSSDVRVDQNRDGSAEDDDKIPITGKLTPVTVTVGTGPEERPWAFMCITGIEQDIYHDFQMNLLPQHDFMTLYTVAAASMVGTIGETPVRVIDDNMDGVYGSPPLEWGHMGMTDGMLQPELDSLVIGASKRAVPWSEYVQVGGQWYKLEAAKGGKELVATPATVRTGTLKLKFKGGKPAWVVVRGSNKYENCYFDLVGQKSLEVPVGRYSLFYGELRKGKKRQTSKSLILPGGQTPKWTVAEGKTATVELGAPFDFDFRFRRSGDEVTVLGSSVVVTGVNQERYERAWNAVPRPDVSWRKAGTKRGSKGEGMEVIHDMLTADKLGLEKAWKPLDLTVRVNLSDGDEVELQLVQKKNPLFGKVESSWRGDS